MEGLDYLGNIQCRVDHEDPIIIYFNALLEPKIHSHINFMLLSLIEKIFISFSIQWPNLKVQLYFVKK